MSFKKNKYQVIRGAISKEVADIAYRYLQISAEADHWMLNNGVTHAGNKLVGNFNDPQVPNSYAKYGDRLMETLLVKTIDVMQKKTGLKLVPTYSYTRLYRKGNILRRHKDRPSCEISATVCLDWNDSNCQKRKPWPIWIKNDQGEIAINLEPGDAMVYKGCEVEHWREPFHGNACAQVFYHYTDVNGERFNPWDGRPHGGIPHGIQRGKEEKENKDD